MVDVDEQIEVLVVDQGFDRGDRGKIEDFTMSDFRAARLPNFSEPRNLYFKHFYQVEKYLPESACPWGCSRYIAGEDGKLKLLDQNVDSSG